MKSLICAVFAVAVLAAPTLSFAQATNAPVTRAEVKADLARVEQAGYRPASNDC
jgi:Ni/Co efflux regulator RcnB